MGKWNFKELTPGDKTREPIQGEFFSTDAIRNTAEALIREGVQNTLDATRAGERAKIRIYCSTENGALSSERSSIYFKDSWEHLLAEGNGLIDPPLSTNHCPYLVFEDFGTTGLEGDITQWHDIAGNKNAFFYFFRAEGRSGKGEKDRGRWGIGKYVFPRSSRISTLFGLTVRADDGHCLLMGQTVLKSHRVGEKYYSPDGLFGTLAEDGLVLPLTDKEFIASFSQDFNLIRRHEAGLSIVVPWCDPEIRKELLLEGILRGYFFPILSDNLEVSLETPDSKLLLSSATIEQAIANASTNVTIELAPLIKLAKWARTQDPANIPCINMPNPDRAPKWSVDLFPEVILKTLKEALESGNPQAVRVPIAVQVKNSAPETSFFDIFLERVGGNESGTPVFIREGIIISDIRKARVRGIRSLIIIEDKSLAAMLGDSENPAHTQWQKDGSKFKNKYRYGSSVIDFVTRSVSEIMRILSDQEREEDPTILADIFSLPSEEEIETPATTSSPKSAKQPGTVNVPLTSKPRLYNVQKNAGGFTIFQGEGFSPPAMLDIRVAYDIRRGNPVKKYKPADFELDSSPIRLEPAPEGIDILSLKYNRVIFRARESNFRMTFVGFDEQRDLYVKVTGKGGGQ